jgi:aspartate 1-decarboxylase
MTLTMLKSKIHRATVTGADLDYEGSISISPDLIEAAGLLPWERVDIYDITNGQRFSTYVILGEPGGICLNGAAARLVQKGDLVIIASYCGVEAAEARAHKPRVVLVDGANRPTAVHEDPAPEGGAFPGGGIRIA